MHVPCIPYVPHAPPIAFFLVDLITRNIYGEQYKPRGSSLCSFQSYRSTK